MSSRTPPVADIVTRTERADHREPRGRSYPVAVHLAFYAVSVLIPVLLIVAWMLIDMTRLRRDDALRDATTVVRNLNATLDVEMEKAVAVGQTLATSRMLATGDYAAFDVQARDIAAKLGIIVVVRDPTGQQLINTGVPPGTKLPVSVGIIRELDRLTAELGAPVISDLVFGTTQKAPFVFADIPVVNASNPALFIDVALFPRRLAEILSQELPNGWIAGLIGRDGRLIARSVDQDRYIGTINQPFLAVATGAEGVWTGQTRDGETIQGAYVRSPLSGWITSVAVPEAMLHAPAREAMLGLGGLVVASLVGSLFLGWRFSRLIAAPIRDLVTGARVLGRGASPHAAYSRVDEVNEVAEALLAAAAELDRRAAAAAAATAAVRANEERLQLVQDTAGIGTFDLDIETDTAIGSPLFYRMFALPPPDTRVRPPPPGFADVLARVHPDDRQRIERARDELYRHGGPFEDEFRIVTSDGEQRWIYLRGRLDLKDGGPVRLLAASIDISGRKQAEEHLRFLLRELSHRSKNLLAVIQAMAGQTAKSAESVDVFRRRFGERLMGLAASHDLLVNQNWMGASVEQLVRGQLSPFVDARDPRVRIQGPEVDLKAEAAEALGLALHELATNSLKYGALSDPAGRVEIVWEVYRPCDSVTLDQHTPDPDGRRFRMDWIEHTIAPVPPPSHKGFGRMVIEHTVEATLNGTVRLEFPPEGLRWRIDAPATCLAPSDRGLAA